MTDWVDQNYVGMGIFSTIMSTVWIVMGFIALEACSDITASGLSISEGQILVLYLIGTGAFNIVFRVVEIIARIKIEKANESECCFPPSQEFPKSLFGRIFKGINGWFNIAWLIFGTYYFYSKPNGTVQHCAYTPYQFATTMIIIQWVIFSICFAMPVFVMVKKCTGRE